MTGEAFDCCLLLKEHESYPQIDFYGLGASCSCGSTQNILRQNPKAAIASATVVLRTVQTLTFIRHSATSHSHSGEHPHIVFQQISDCL